MPSRLKKTKMDKNILQHLSIHQPEKQLGTYESYGEHQVLACTCTTAIEEKHWTVQMELEKVQNSKAEQFAININDLAEVDNRTNIQMGVYERQLIDKYEALYKFITCSLSLSTMKSANLSV